MRCGERKEEGGAERKGRGQFKDSKVWGLRNKIRVVSIEKEEALVEPIWKERSGVLFSTVM